MSILDRPDSSWNRYPSLRSLIVGAWNFAFGYGVFAGLYWALRGVWRAVKP